MTCTQHYDSPLGGMLLAADEVRGLPASGSRGKSISPIPSPGARPGGDSRPGGDRRWLDVYFSGREPDFLPPLHPLGSPFRQAVWELLLQIPYGRTVTYGDLARQLAERQGLPHMVRPGRGRRGGTQPHLHPYPLPPGVGHRRQPHRLCRGHRQESQAAGAGGGGHDRSVPPQARRRPLSSK